jgi:branched-chain amino acid transport system ATP-binding protein
MMDALVCDGISVSFSGVRILMNISFSIDPGTIVGLVGPNGSGKTTLLDVIAGRVAPSKGRVLLGAEALTGRASHRLAACGLFRSFQEGRLFRRLTVKENIAAAFRPLPDEGISAALALIPQIDAHASQRVAAVSDALKSAGMDLDCHRPAAEMSYGARKRIIMEQAIVFDSVICLLDEPIAGLDPDSRSRMVHVISTLRKPNRIILLVEHDLGAVEALADRVLLMDRGRVVADGPPREVRLSERFFDTYLHANGR